MRIYRGVSKEFDSNCQGLVIAKGSCDELDVECGDTNACFGNELLAFGASAGNAQYFHNFCSDMYKTCYVSFTIDENIARKFATYAGVEPGWIYVTDTDLLSTADIGFLPGCKGLHNDEEGEVLVNLSGRTHLPKVLIIEKRRVEPDS